MVGFPEVAGFSRMSKWSSAVSGSASPGGGVALLPGENLVMSGDCWLSRLGEGVATGI